MTSLHSHRAVDKKALGGAHAHDVAKLTAAMGANIGRLRKALTKQARNLNAAEKTDEGLLTKVADQDAHDRQQALSGVESTAEQAMTAAEARLEAKEHAHERATEAALVKRARAVTAALKLAAQRDGVKLSVAQQKAATLLAHRLKYHAKRVDHAGAKVRARMAEASLAAVQRMLAAGKNAVTEEVGVEKDVDRTEARQATLVQSAAAADADKVTATSNASEDDEDELEFKVRTSLARQVAAVTAYFDAAHERLVADLKEIQAEQAKAGSA